MANDIEKENEKLEKQNKKLKKKNKAGGKIILVLLLIIVILAALLFFLDPFGWGIGPNAGNSSGGNGTGDESAETTAASETLSDQELSVAPEVRSGEYEENADKTAYTDITVSGSTYIFGTEEITLEDFIAAINAYEEEVYVKILDRDATKNAMDELTAALDANGSRYAINTGE